MDFLGEDFPSRGRVFFLPVRVPTLKIKGAALGFLLWGECPKPTTIAVPVPWQTTHFFALLRFLAPGETPTNNTTPELSSLSY